MKDIIKSKHGLLIFGIISSLIAEYIKIKIPVNEFWEYLIGVSLSLIILFISVKWENAKNKIGFYEIIRKLIPDIKAISSRWDVSSKLIQNLMSNLVSALGDKMNMIKILNENSFNLTDFEEGKKLPCGICNDDHYCGEKGKCTICKLNPGLWVELSDSKTNKK